MKKRNSKNDVILIVVFFIFISYFILGIYSLLHIMYSSGLDLPDWLDGLLIPIVIPGFMFGYLLGDTYALIWIACLVLILILTTISFIKKKRKGID